jgi:hypothetical protein
LFWPSEGLTLPCGAIVCSFISPRGVRTDDFTYITWHNDTDEMYWWRRKQLRKKNTIPETCIPLG